MLGQPSSGGSTLRKATRPGYLPLSASRARVPVPEPRAPGATARYSTKRMSSSKMT